jgi:membrane protein DedA with SNARE-associated domain
LIFIFMTIESSFLPLPSEIVMIPAGFMAYRRELTFGEPGIDLIMVFISGVAGSIAGAYINYFLAMYLGRPFLYKYGKYFLIKPDVLTRSEEIFLKYGEITTFICRLILVIRHLISLPAGIARMPLGRFTLFTGLGAAIWCLILMWAGYYLGSLSVDMTYAELVHKGKQMIMDHYIWIIIFIILLLVAYGLIHHLVIKSKKNKEVRQN